MSELINNRKQRREQLKKIILDIHANENPEELKVRFKDLINEVGPGEIAELEQELIDEGLQVAEVQKLCDVHASLFKESLLQQEPITSQPGHPIDTFKKENRAIEDVLTEVRKLTEEILIGKKTRTKEELLNLWKEQHNKLIQIDKHYSRKENILFPYLEKKGINGPPSVMWSVDDEIRDQLKEISSMLQNPEGDIKQFIEDKVRPALTAVEEMIFKEENILFGMCMENLTPEEWIEIYKQSDDIGYSLITPEGGWQPADALETKPKTYTEEKGLIGFETGNLTPKEMELIFNNLPIDITFVDEKDEVRYFSHGQDRIFARTKAIIGRKVHNCHPPDSVHVVNKIVDEFKRGERDKAEFWLEMNGMFVYITYFPLRDESGKYLGTIEVTQNIKKLRELQGEKRILDEEKT